MPHHEMKKEKMSAGLSEAESEMKERGQKIEQGRIEEKEFPEAESEMKQRGKEIQEKMKKEKEMSQRAGTKGAETSKRA